MSVCLSVETRDLLCQLLRVESLVDEFELLALIKDELRLSHTRGFHHGAEEGARSAGPRIDLRRAELRPILPSAVAWSPTSRGRRRGELRCSKRLRIRNAMATAVLLVLAGAAVVAATALLPQLSAESRQARHRIDLAR